MEPTNVQRSERARKALEFYKEHCLKEGGPVGEEELTDLLTDLRHLLENEKGFSPHPFEVSVEISEINFEYELAYREE